MRKKFILKQIPFIFLHMILFYIPPLRPNYGAGGWEYYLFLLFEVNISGCLIMSLIYGIVFHKKYMLFYYPITVALLFTPSILFFYPAYRGFTVIYVIISIIGLSCGFFIWLIALRVKKYF